MPEEVEHTPGFSSREKRRVVRAAALRAWNLVVLVTGLGIFVTTLTWWMLPLTIAVYLLLVFLAYRDPLFRDRALGRTSTPGSREITPERRASWLPRGETRRRVEEALGARRKVMTAIRESDETTRELLGDAAPRLDEVADHLVGVALARERAAQTLRELEGRTSETELRDIEQKIRRADTEISGISERLFALRAQVVRISMQDPSRGGKTTNHLVSSLDEMRLRLQALEEILRSPDEDRHPTG
ncbi:hypothetical protein [Rubrobacter calidifluminis]|uniref:hypothetical protein n=1 Tax=Rubrobacter calidifluminis TaxID=1392640 RepID=UPI00235F09B3|nr:hypothetical protein [Rubrobacter calidifluminis]